MTDHPCKGMSNRATITFERIAVGDALPAAPKSVFESLLAKGLIKAGAEKQLGDSLGKFSIPQYFVPLHVHCQWCEWCGEQPDIEEAS